MSVVTTVCSIVWWGRIASSPGRLIATNIVFFPLYAGGFEVVKKKWKNLVKVSRKNPRRQTRRDHTYLLSLELWSIARSSHLFCLPAISTVCEAMLLTITVSWPKNGWENKISLELHQLHETSHPNRTKFLSSCLQGSRCTKRSFWMPFWVNHFSEGNS